MPAHGLTVWPGLQLSMRYSHSWGTFHAMVFRRHSLGLRWSCADCDIWSHRRTCAQSGSTACTFAKAAVYSVDDWTSNPGGSHHCWGESPQVHESLDQQQSTDAPLQGHGLRRCQWDPLCTLSAGRQISSRIACPYDRGQTQWVRPMAVLDDSARPTGSRPHSTLLPASRFETLFY